MSAKHDPATLPCSPLDETAGLKYFPRMLAKIRLHAAGKLWEDLHANLGKGSDGALVDFLHISYDELKARVLQGGTDEEILEWCCQNGNRPTTEQIEIWNGFMSKRGWRDAASKGLVEQRAEAGFHDREDIVTFFDLMDAEEGHAG
jgi:gluconokinase